MLGSTGAFGGVGGTAGLIVDVTAAQTSSLSATGNTIRTKGINIAFGAVAVAFGPIQIGGIGSATTHTITNNSASGAYQGILFKGGGSARTLTIAGTGDYTINTDAIHSAGRVVANVDKVGRLGFYQNLTYAAGSIFEWDLNANKDTDGLDDNAGLTTDNGARGDDFDAVDVTGNSEQSGGLNPSIDSISDTNILTGNITLSGTGGQRINATGNLNLDGPIARDGSNIGILVLRTASADSTLTVNNTIEFNSAGMNIQGLGTVILNQPTTPAELPACSRLATPRPERFPTTSTVSSKTAPVGSPTTSSAAVDLSAGKVKIAGTPASSTSYTLLTTTATISGTPVLAGSVPGFSLVVEGGNVLKLIPNPPYEDWLLANPPATGFTTDSDNDGVPNGVENVLGTNPNASSAGLTQVSATAGSAIFTHTLNPTVAGDVVLTYQWSADLVEWKSSAAPNAAAIATMRQLQVANMGYAIDTNGQYIPIAEVDKGGGLTMEWYKSPKFRAYLSGDPNEADKSANEMLVAPVSTLDPIVVRRKQRQWDRLSASYGINSTGLTWPKSDKGPYMSYKISQVADPGRTAFIASATNYMVSFGGRYLWKAQPTEGKTTTDKMAFRHDNKAVVIFYDGSTKLITQGDLAEIDRGGGAAHPFWKATQ